MIRARLLALSALLASTAVLVPGCSNETSSTSPPVPSGPNFNFTFPATNVSHSLVFISEGSWAYRCVPHQGAGMTGTVNVVAASPNDSAYVEVGPGDLFQFVPGTVTIKPGGSVRWRNVSTMTNHTVTR